MLADDRAANPFESVLRAIALDVPGLHVRRPQLRIATEPAARIDVMHDQAFVREVLAAAVGRRAGADRSRLSGSRPRCGPGPSADF